MTERLAILTQSTFRGYPIGTMLEVVDHDGRAAAYHKMAADRWIARKACGESRETVAMHNHIVESYLTTAIRVIATTPS